ncbi:MAG: glycolate oxidase binding subunit [Chloroflexota bacterium]|nr:glycolate oxidase binding subunit [Chloroflexota bacterium]
MSTAAAPARTLLERAAGEEAVRPGTAADAVGGIVPAAVVSPADEAAVAAVCSAAHGAGLALVVRGAGTRQGWGRPPRRCDAVLDTSRLRGVVEHAPGDLVCTVRAGTPLDELREVLAAAPGHRQWLPLDPPQPGAQTVGGLVATAAAGPLRVRYGTARDLVIGARFVLGDGTVGHSGGRVVKNVAGYDVTRLLVGSLGTLAVITEVTVRLHPLPPASRTLLLERASPARLAALSDLLRTAPVVLSAADVCWPDATARLRVEGTEEAVDEQAAALAGLTGARVVDAAEARALEAGLAVRPWRGEGAVAGLAVPRSRLAELLELASAYAVEMVVRAPLGVAEARLPERPEVVAQLRTAVERLGGHLVLHRGGPGLAAVAWPAASGPEVTLMRALKRSLDPAGVLAPGRALGDEEAA